jgi:hypothetical protein
MEVRVTRGFTVVPILRMFFTLISEIALLYVLYGFIYSRFPRLPSWVKWLDGRLVLILLSIISFPVLGLYIAAYVQENVNTFFIARSYRQYEKVGAAWNIIYFIAAVEILIWAVVVLVRKSPIKNAKRVRSSIFLQHSSDLS